MIVAWTDEALTAVNSLELLGIIYLAIAVSVIRERLARMEERQNMEKEQRKESRLK